MIELIAVIVVTGLLAAVAAPSIASIGPSRQTAAARVLYHDLLYARQYAVATGSRVWVVFDVGADRWSLLVEDRDNPGLANAQAIVDPATGYPMVVTLGSAVWSGAAISSAIFDGNDTLGFDWLGRPLSESETLLAADGSIALSGGATIHVLAGTGHVTLTLP